jgi:xylulose-5-phosphate/fructose-6-phosphate phosphoketolase
VDHCLRSRNYVNVVVAGKQPAPPGSRWTRRSSTAARALASGLGQHGRRVEPDVVLACAGDVPTLEALAAAELLRRHLPDLKVRFVNVVDLMRLQTHHEHPHGMPTRVRRRLHARQADHLRLSRLSVLIHRLTYRRTNHGNLHVRGYKEEGTTTTPFDMVMLNDLDRFHLVIDVIDRVPGLAVAPCRPATGDGR